MMQMPPLQQMHMQQQVPNQSQQPPQAQQQPPSQTQQIAQTPHLQQNQHFLSTHSQADQNQRNGMKQREQALFNSYVYDFLKRSGALETARTYLREGGENIKLKNDGNSINGNTNSSSDSDGNAPLPEADVPVQAPEGFLYEWWTVFWDIYSAKLNRPGTMEAQRYVAAEMRRGNRMHISQIPTMNTYQQHPQVVAQAAAQQQHQQQQQQQQIQRLQMQIPQHTQQQAQQASQQAVQQQQQAPPPQQTPQPPQQTPQPQPQHSPANHQQVSHQQPQQFNNRQQMSNGVIDVNNTNGDMLTSPRTMKMSPQAIRRPMNNMNIQQVRLLAMQHQQHHQLQNNAQAQAQAAQAHAQAQVQAQVQAQAQAQAVQAQAQSSQQIQSQGQQQQNPGVNQGQVQQQAASQVQMTPNSVPAQLNPGTKRNVEGQAINQNINQQTASPTKRPRIMNDYGAAGRQPQQPPNHQGQMMNQNMTNLMLTTPISAPDISSSPDIKSRQPHLANGKKSNPPLQQQLARVPPPQQQQQQQQQQQMPINKQHINQPINPMVQAQDTELFNQIKNLSAASSQTLSSISSFPMLVNQRLQPNYVTIPRAKINQNMLLNEKNMIENFSKVQQMRPNIPPQAAQALFYQQFQQHQQQQQQQQVVPHPAVSADMGPNNPRKNDTKVKNVKTTPTQSQPQPPSGNANVVIPQQSSIIGTNGVQAQSQQPNQATSTTNVGQKQFQMNLEDVLPYEGLEFDGSDFDISQDFDLNEYISFDDGEIGSGNNAGASTSTTNGN